MGYMHPKIPCTNPLEFEIIGRVGVRPKGTHFKGYTPTPLYSGPFDFTPYDTNMSEPFESYSANSKRRRE